MAYKITNKIKNLLRNSIEIVGTQEKLANAIGISEIYLSRYLNGKVKSCQLETWRKLQDYFPEIDDREKINLDGSPLSDEDLAILKYYQDENNKIERYELLAKIERKKKESKTTCINGASEELTGVA